MTQPTRNNLLKNEIFYPTIHETDEKMGIVVTTSGFQIIPANHSYPPEGHPKTYAFHYGAGRILNEFQIIYITSGKGVFSSKETEEIVLNEGSIFILFPGMWHTYRPLPEIGWEAYWVGFRGDFVENLTEKGFLIQNNPFYQVGYNETIVNLFQEINENSKREEPGAQALLGGIVMHMLGILFHFRKNEVFSNKAFISLIAKAKVIMREHVLTDITAEEIANKLNISYSWFRRTFKEYTGFSPSQFMVQLRIQKAKEFLEQRNDSVKQIALQLNFESISYFSVFFKRETGLSPHNYRALCRIK
jgi:AraC-like DNA-binding protein